MKKVMKIASLVLAATMLVMVFAACGTSNTATEIQSAETKVVKFGTNAEFPPFEFIGANGVIEDYDGIDIQIAKNIGEDNNFESKIENMEFDSLLVALENGQIDAAIAGMTVTEERLEKVDFSVPYYTATQVMIVKKDSEIKKATDMEGKRIVVIQGYTGETCVQDMGYEYEAFKKGSEAILELSNGKCDVVVIDSATASKYIADNKDLMIVEDSEAFEAEEYAIAVKKGNKELLDKINASVNKMLEDGTIGEIAAKYTEG